MMYLPCQPGPGGLAFFEVYDGDPLDPGLWLAHNVVPIPSPQRMHPELRIHLPARKSETANGGSTAPAHKLLQSAAAKIFSEGKGHRNDNLYYAARTCFALADAGLLDTVDVETTLSGAARSAGLDATEIRSTMASARKGAWKKQAFAEEMRIRTAGSVEGA